MLLSTASKVSLPLLFLLTFGSSAACGAGCSSDDCGIPCYLRDAEDSCHYRIRDDSGCSSRGDTQGLEEKLQQLNKSLTDLQDRLVKKGVIPPGDTCPKLSPISHGGVIYSDLALFPGVNARYACDQGYSLHGYGEYNCSEDGVWSGNTSDVPSCEVSVKECRSLITIPHGHVVYQTRDTPAILPGDIASYICDAPYILLGSQDRFCLRNGSWSGLEPLCTAVCYNYTMSADPQRNESSQGLTANVMGSENSYVKSVVGITLGLVTAVVLVVVAIMVIAINIARRKHQKTVRSISLLDEEYVPIDKQHLLPSNVTVTTGSDSAVSSGVSVNKLASSEEKRDSKPEDRVETLQAE